MASNLNSNEKARAVFVAVMMRTHDKKKASKASGLKSGELRTILHKLDSTGSLADDPRSGRPTKFTPDILGKAVEIIIHNSKQLLTTRDLLEAMIAAGLLPSNTCIDNFREHLKEYVHHLGYRLITTKTSTQFFISLDDIPERLEACNELKDLLADIPLEQWIVVDETTIDLGGHPKGMEGPGT